MLFKKKVSLCNIDCPALIIGHLIFLTVALSFLFFANFYELFNCMLLIPNNFFSYLGLWHQIKKHSTFNWFDLWFALQFCNRVTLPYFHFTFWVSLAKLSSLFAITQQRAEKRSQSIFDTYLCIFTLLYAWFFCRIDSYNKEFKTYLYYSDFLLEDICNLIK